jgi:hypothetical protein
MEKHPPSLIYLIPLNNEEYDYVWCEDPAPEPDMEPADAIAYVRADDRYALERALKNMRVA